MMATAGLVEFLRELPAGVEVDEVVVAELLALELLGAGDAGAGSVGVEGGALVGVFAVAQRHGERIGDAEGGGEARRQLREFREDWNRLLRGLGPGDLFERVGDGRVIGSGEREGLLGETPAGLAAERAVVGLEFFGEGRVVGNRGDDGDIFKVLGGGANHGGAADVDVLNDLGEGGAGAWKRFFQRRRD